MAKRLEARLRALEKLAEQDDESGPIIEVWRQANAGTDEYHLAGRERPVTRAELHELPTTTNTIRIIIERF